VDVDSTTNPLVLKKSLKTWLSWPNDEDELMAKDELLSMVIVTDFSSCNDAVDKLAVSTTPSDCFYLL